MGMEYPGRRGRVKARLKEREQNVGNENRNIYTFLSRKVEFGDGIFSFFSMR
jgi:hypothetical protein